MCISGSPSRNLFSSFLKGGDDEDGSTIGASITGIKDINSLTDDEIKTIRQALVDYKVLLHLSVSHPQIILKSSLNNM